MMREAEKQDELERTIEEMRDEFRQEKEKISQQSEYQLKALERHSLDLMAESKQRWARR